MRKPKRAARRSKATKDLSPSEAKKVRGGVTTSSSTSTTVTLTTPKTVFTNPPDTREG